ncbi:MAG: metallophosphoesterase [Tyzzerella sp.]|nr:metallophosphoesterase [Tyzzerella sp.]
MLDLTFSVFADFHYKKGMYAATVADLEAILKRASDENVDFIIHAGDFSNDYVGSPEVVNLYLDNPYKLPAYGIYGNHELESRGNSMETVNKFLTNDKNVIWGGDSVGYYYFDKNGYRIVCTDTNYSWNEKLQVWEHNKTASWGEPVGNKVPNSLGPVQLEWLERVLTDAAKQKKSCIVLGHASFTERAKASPDTEAVLKIFQKVNQIEEKTVILCINGHYHTNRVEMKDGIVYFDVNAVLNGSWELKKEHHYTKEHTFVYEEYDKEGRKTGECERKLTELWQSVNTHYFASPLDAVVKISDECIEITGSETTWRYGVEPESYYDPDIMPKISSGRFCFEKR